MYVQGCAAMRKRLGGISKMNLQEILSFARDVKISSLLLAEYFLSIPEPYNEEIPPETLSWAKGVKSCNLDCQNVEMNNPLEVSTVQLSETGTSTMDDSDHVIHIVLKNLVDFWQDEVFYQMYSLMPSVKPLLYYVKNVSLQQMKTRNCTDALLSENEFLIAEGKHLTEEVKKLQSRLKVMESEVEQSNSFQEIIVALQSKVQDLTEKLKWKNSTPEQGVSDKNDLFETILAKRTDERVQELEESLNHTYKRISFLKRSCDALSKQWSVKRRKGLRAFTSNLYYRTQRYNDNNSQLGTLRQTVKRALQSCGHCWNPRRTNTVDYNLHRDTVSKMNVVKELQERQHKLVESLNKAKEENEALKIQLIDFTRVSVELRSKTVLIEELKKTLIRLEELVSSQAGSLQMYYEKYGYKEKSNETQCSIKRSSQVIKRRYSCSALDDHGKRSVLGEGGGGGGGGEEQPSLISLANRHQYEIDRLKHSHEKKINDLKYKHDKELTKVREDYLQRLVKAQLPLDGGVTKEKSLTTTGLGDNSSDVSAHQYPLSYTEKNQDIMKAHQNASPISEPNFLLRLPSSTATIHVPLSAFQPDKLSITLHVTIPAQDFYISTKNQTVRILSNDTE